MPAVLASHRNAAIGRWTAVSRSTGRSPFELSGTAWVQQSAGSQVLSVPITGSVGVVSAIVGWVVGAVVAGSVDGVSENGGGGGAVCVGASVVGAIVGPWVGPTVAVGPLFGLVLVLIGTGTATPPGPIVMPGTGVGEVGTGPSRV